MKVNVFDKYFDYSLVIITQTLFTSFSSQTIVNNKMCSRSITC